MIDWLRPLLLMFYAPARGMSEVRETAPLGPATLLALLAQAAHVSYTESLQIFSPFVFVRQLVVPLLFVALVFVPTLIFLANLFERRASFGVAIQQEYAATASTVFYAWAAASLVALPLAILARTSGFEASVFADSMRRVAEWQRQVSPDIPLPPEPLLMAQMAQSFFLMRLLPLFGLWAWVAIRSVFRLSWPRSLAVLLVSAVVMFFASPLLLIFSSVVASPFLLLLLFFFMRGYFNDVMRTQRARASFRQNLEAATLNPADASAHYNLGLIHLQRKEVNEARERFKRAVEIDGDETDAHYQLGRIARAQDRYADAIKHFEQVVVRDEGHAANEIWREIAATYIAAGQYADADEALERFLERRPSDPEGLYLKGRALAGEGRRREAVEAMRACIEAVKTAPAYKYRTEKRWLNEAQQFLRSQA